MIPKILFPALLGLALAMSARADENSAARKFDFVSGGVSPANSYSRETGFGFGFDLGSVVTNLPGGGVTGDKPFFFSVALPEGNYRVTATFGDKSGATTNTVKAGARRLMLENLTTTNGEIVARNFTVNTRTVDFPGGKVHLKPRELTNETVTWDDKLTLEFNGARPGLRTLEIAPATNVTAVFLAGDSTVCDQPREPCASWGQMLPRLFRTAGCRPLRQAGMPDATQLISPASHHNWL